MIGSTTSASRVALIPNSPPQGHSVSIVHNTNGFVWLTTPGHGPLFSYHYHLWTTPGCFSCPLLLLQLRLGHTASASSIVPFWCSKKSSGERLFSWHRDTNVYRSYVDNLQHEKFVFVDFFRPGDSVHVRGTRLGMFCVPGLAMFASMLKNGTQSVSLKHKALYPQSCQTLSADSSSYGCYIDIYMFRLFHPLLLTSFTGFILYRTMFIPRLAMVLPDQPEERTLLTLKRRYSDMDCIHYILRTRLRENMATPSRKPCRRRSPAWSSTDHESPSTRRVTSIRNTASQVTMAPHPKRDPFFTVRHQLSVARHNLERNMDNVQLSIYRRHLIGYSAHDFLLCPHLQVSNQHHAMYKNGQFW